MSSFKITVQHTLQQICPDSFTSLYKNIYLNFDEYDMKNILHKAENIVTKIKNNKNSISLLIGQVQSGKTATYSAIIAQLFDLPDNQCNLVILTCGSENTLLEQTYIRLEKTFSKKAKIIKCNSNDFESIPEYLSNEEKIILVLLKHTKYLKIVKELIQKINNNDLINMPIFIDDEGDQASFNNILKENDSAIYSAIKMLYESRSDMNMITVTATPMPQILVHQEYNIKPNLIFYMEPGKKYFGLEKFINDENNHIIEINNEDGNNVVNGKITPPSFKKAIIHFFINCSIAHLIDGNIKTRTMLIHIDNLKSNHVKIRKTIKNFINNFINKDMKSSIEYKKIINEIIAENNIKELIAENNINSEKLIDFDFIKLIQSHAKYCDLCIVNNDNKDINLNQLNEKNYIFIGSTMLQRGVTLKNLLVTYFTYRSENIINADTVLQRARWFGYREHENLIKVYMSEVAVSDFNAIFLMNSELIDRFKYYEENEINFKNFERNVLLPGTEKLNATRQSVIKNGRVSISLTNSNNSIDTCEEAEELFKKVNSINSSSYQNFFDGYNFKIKEFENYCDFEDWLGIDKLDKIFKHLNIINENKIDFDNFVKLQNPSFVVATMNSNNDDGVRRREILMTDSKNLYKNNFISIAQGRNKNYPGDKYWGEWEIFKNTVIMQLHKIELKSKNNHPDNGKIIYKPLLIIPKKILSQKIYPID